MIDCRSDNIVGWLYTWEDLTREERGKDLVVARSVANIVRVLRSKLEQYCQEKPHKRIERSSPRLERELLGLLEQAAKTDDWFFLLRRERPAELQQLESLLQEGAYNAEAICAALAGLERAPSVALLVDELANQLLDPRADFRMISSISYLLIYRVVATHSLRRLRDLAHSALVRVGSEIVLQGRIDPLTRDEAVGRQVADSWRALLCDREFRERVGAFMLQDSRDLFRRSAASLWPHTSYQLLDCLRRLWVAALDPFASGGGLASAVEQLLRDDASLSRLGSSVLQDHVAQLVGSAVGRSLLAGGTEHPCIGFLGSCLGDFLAGACGFRDSVPVELSQRPNMLDLVAAEASSKVFAQHAGRLFTAWAGSQESIAAAMDLGRVCTEALMRATTAAGVHVTDLKVICLDWSADKDLHERLRQVLLPLHQKLADDLDSLCDDFSAVHPGLERNERERFWREWADAFARSLGSHNSASRCIPWGAMSADEFRHTFHRVVAELFRPPDRWHVLFPVRGVRPDGEVWAAGDVTFYDPERMDHGEAGWFSRARDEKTDIAVARVVVSADTREAAHRAGLQTVNSAVSTVSSALSGRGLKLEVENCLHYEMPESTAEYYPGAETPRSGTAQIHSPKKGPLRKVCEAVDHLLRLANRDPRKLTELQRRFLRASHWYAKGRWEDDLADAFLFYWIALEQIFVEGEKNKTRLFWDAAKLCCTWYDLDESRVLLDFRRSIVVQIERDPELRDRVATCSVLDGWNRDKRVLLRPASMAALVDLTPDDKRAAKAYFKKVADDLTKVAAGKQVLAKEIQDRRDAYRFRLHLLYDARNSLVHEGISDAQTIHFYLEALAEAVEKVLRKMVDEAIREVPVCSTIDELIEEYEPPWA